MSCFVTTKNSFSSYTVSIDGRYSEHTVVSFLNTLLCCVLCATTEQQSKNKQMQAKYTAFVNLLLLINGFMNFVYFIV